MVGLTDVVAVSIPAHVARVGLGLIIGGALGNAIDRLAHAAVVDYLDLHAFGRHFFVFNIADAAINVGVALLILELLFVPRASKSRSGQPFGNLKKAACPADATRNVATSSNSRNWWQHAFEPQRF